MTTSTLGSTTTSGGFQLSTFGTSSLPFGSSSMPATSGLFGSTSQTASVTPQQQPVSSQIGLGGFSSTMSSSGTTTAGSSGDVDSKPLEGVVPTELVVLVSELKNKLKANKDKSDQIASASMDEIRSLAADIRDTSKQMHSADSNVRKLINKSSTEQARNDVRLGGTVQRGQETIPTYTIGSNALQTIGYMHNLNDHYDRMLASYRDQLEQLELFISSKLNNEPTETYTDAQMMEHLRRIDETFKSVASGVYRTHSQVQDLKDAVMRHRREDPFQRRSNSLPPNMRGPDPFHQSSQTVLMSMAQMLGKNIGNQSTAVPSSFGTFGSSLFAQKPTPTFTGFGSTSTASAPLIKPFGTATTVPTFSSNSLSSTAVVAPSVPSSSSSSQPFSFGSTLSSPLGGTLFSGSANKTPFGK